MKHIFMCVFTLFLSLTLRAQTMGEITVVVDGVQSSQGNILIAACRNNDEFKQKARPELGARVPAVVPSTRAVLKLPVGEYAISIVHDANNNGKIDQNMIGIPKEMYGISNNKYSKIGAQPPFKEAVVSVTTEPQTIHIKLRKF